MNLGPSEAMTCINEVFKLSELLKCDRCDLSELLLPADDPRITAELERRTSSPHDMDHCAEAGQHKWQCFHANLFQSQGLSFADIKPDPLLNSNPWYGLLPRRCKQALVYTYKYSDQGDAKEMTSCDIGQRIDRVAKGWDGSTQTLIPSATTFLLPSKGTGFKDFSECRLLCGREALAIQGFPCEWLDEVPRLSASEPMLMDLAGNAFPGLVFSAVYSSMLAIVPFFERRPSHHSEPMDLQAIMTSLMTEAHAQ